MPHAHRVTIGIFHRDSGQLMAHVQHATFAAYSDARKWALEQLTFYSPSPYQFRIDPI